MDERAKTARNWKQVGRAYKVAFPIIHVGDTVLDFGSGYGQGLDWLKEHTEGVEYFKYDLNPKWSNCSLYQLKADVIIASNVLNVQSNFTDLLSTLEDIKSFKRALCSPVVLNYPKEPRKMNLSNGEMLEIVKHILSEPVIFTT